MNTIPSNTQRVAIAAPHFAAVEAAREVTAAGGNAIDAAVAAAAVLTVVYPHMCSVGGDVIALVRKPDGQQVCVNASGAYGSAPEAQAALARTGGNMPILGPLTVSVPGAVSGWAALLEHGGSLPAADVLAPAIRLARDGMTVSPGLAEAIELDKATLLQDEGMKSMFFVDGTPRRAGDIVIQSALAETLSQLAHEGLDSMYRGSVATRLADGLKSLGVPVTEQDLANHRPSIEPALTRSFGPLTVSTAAPNSQGYTMLRNLGAVFAHTDDPSTVNAGLLAELFYSSDALRDNQLADPRFVEVDVEAELSDEALHRALASAQNSLAGKGRPHFAHTPRPGGDTVGVAAVSADGTAVSLIQSVFHSFGSQLLEPDTGLVLHNRAAFFTLDPTSPNLLQPGKRPAHTLVPVIVEHENGTLSAHGTMGGKAQSQIHTQLILRSLEGLSPLRMVAAPRFIVGGLEAGSSNDRIMIEPSLETGRAAQIRETTMTVTEGKDLDSNAGHSMVARLNADGSLEAGADPRSDGAAWAGN
ncbi:gamma-glutamyltransferase [Arthrobacter ginkgonis]|uniref:Gamma-glutamyltransferase n=1 Tax=Arthrobacter ginkgonis TaxID=1630594 RepID=A0ABP7BRA6_9MICC